VICWLYALPKHGGEAKHFPMSPWNLVFGQHATLYILPEPCEHIYALATFFIIFKFNKLSNHLLDHVIIKSIFGSMVAVAFQITFRVEIHADNFFIF